MPQRLRVLDASEWQGRPPWAPILALGYFGAIVKAGEHEHEDPSFLFNAAQLDKAGARLRGAYYFGHPGEDPVDAARWFLGTAARRGIKPTTPGTVYVLDLETADGRSPAEVDSWAPSFLGELHRLGAVGREQDRIAGPGQNPHRQVSHHRLVFGDQDAHPGRV